MSNTPDNTPDIAVVAAAFPDEMNNGNSATQNRITGLIQLRWVFFGNFSFSKGLEKRAIFEVF